MAAPGPAMPIAGQSLRSRVSGEANRQTGSESCRNRAEPHLHRQAATSTCRGESDLSRWPGAVMRIDGGSAQLPRWRRSNVVAFGIMNQPRRRAGTTALLALLCWLPAQNASLEVPSDGLTPIRMNLSTLSNDHVQPICLRRILTAIPYAGIGR